ncbi:MAG: ABC transporter substrate-binding protein [bacterium]|nr:ABC transporter substrate-binding protein [bacterium]MDE0289023.1 ABC transporter substrate-binding protein [bacterium]MDE0437017.1 ABC transporter substrate-binding protein [bacterium]
MARSTPEGAGIVEPDDGRKLITRRRFITMSAVAAAGGVLAACGQDAEEVATTPAATSPPATTAATTATTEAMADEAAPATTEAPLTTTVATTAPTTTQPAQVGGTVVVDQATEPPALNPWQFNFQYVIWMSDLVEEPLYRYDDDLKIIPWLASELPTASDDGLTWDIPIREGVQFHNGDTLTAQHVVDLFAKGAESGIWRSRFAFGIDSTEALDDNLLRVNFSKPFSIFLDKLALMAIRHPDNFEATDKFLGTGPFVHTAYDQGSSATFARNDNYWGTQPSIEGVEFRFVADNGARLVNLIRGDSTVYPETEPNSVPLLEAEANITVLNQQSPFEILWWNNVGREPFNDKRIVEAMARSMDRQAVNDIVFGGLGTIAQGMLGPATGGYDPNFKPFTDTADLATARALMSDATNLVFDEDGNIAEGDPVEFDVMFINSPTVRDLGAVLQQQWLAVGLRANLAFLEIAAWVALFFDSDYDIGVSVSTDGPSQGATAWSSLGTARSDHFFNTMKYYNDEYTQLISDSFGEPDDATRFAMWRRANEILTLDFVMTPPVYPPFVVSTHASLQGNLLGPMRTNRLALENTSFVA